MEEEKRERRKRSVSRRREEEEEEEGGERRRKRVEGARASSVAPRLFCMGRWVGMLVGWVEEN